VTGYVVTRPMGDLAWHYLDFVLGLFQLGHDVFYVEDSEDQPSYFAPTLVPDKLDIAVDQGRSPHEYVQKDTSYGLKFASEVFTLLSTVRLES